MQQLLEAAGSSLQRVAKATVFLADMLELENMNEVFREFFSQQPPARTVSQARLPGGARLQIECVALPDHD